MKIILATTNRSKVEEIEAILGAPGLEILTLDDHPGLVLPPEEGITFKDNALAKARFVASATGIAALGDDSGLEVEALSGAPGVFSARYAGEGASDEENWKKLLEELKGVEPPLRSARFRCVLALVEPVGPARPAGGGEHIFEGTLGGLISTAPKGCGGFGYDPVFFIPRLNRTAAELSPREKNSISHRALALAKLKIWLSERGR
jgi:XTP/dITP diphosphohydrolase